jgi:hypothetical protein
MDDNKLPAVKSPTEYLGSVACSTQESVDRVVLLLPTRTLKLEFQACRPRYIWGYQKKSSGDTTRRIQNNLIAEEDCYLVGQPKWIRKLTRMEESKA